MLLARGLAWSGLLSAAWGLAINEALDFVQLEKRTNCPTDYTDYANVSHPPLSEGKYKLGYQRPPAECRTFVSQEVENKIEELKGVIEDPDLFRLFENSYPNTLDTTVKWRGKAKDSDEELTFVITGDIDAMWIRDSASQLHSYLPFLTNATAESDSLASLFRGLINLQARFLIEWPYCNAFQPPLESGLEPVNNSDASANTKVFPDPDNYTVFECKYELDSIASFLQLSADYYEKTNDSQFFSKYQWTDAVQTLMTVVGEQTYPTYNEDGSIVIAPYTFSAFTNRGTETLNNNAYGNPAAGGTGLVRSAFRPSDDACIYELFVPANMMLAANLERVIPIAKAIKAPQCLIDMMSKRAKLIRDGITKHAVTSEGYFAFEIDGFGSINAMDDTGVPSLLSAPYLGFLERDDKTYQTTRKRILSTSNPYFMKGPVISSISSPHIGPGWGWPMSTITQILTSDDDEEIKDCLRTLVSSTNGLGLIHESIFTFNEEAFTRPWFAWVNGLFGEAILDLYQRKPELLKTSFQ